MASRPTGDPTIRPISKNDEYRVAAEVLSTLEAARARQERRIERLNLENSIGAKPDPHDQTEMTSTRRQATRARLTYLQSEVPTLENRPTENGLLAPVAAALKIASGEAADEALSLAEKIAESWNKIAVLTAGIVAQATVVEEIFNRLSFEACQAFADQNRAQLVAIYRAAQQFAAAVAANDTTRRALIEAGFRWREDILPNHAFAPAILLGGPEQPQSQLNEYRRRLEKMGVL